MIQSTDILMGAFSSRSRSAPMGYSLWEYTGQSWVMRKNVSSPGAVPGEPPRVAGLFPGQIRSQPSVLQPVATPFAAPPVAERRPVVAASSTTRVD